MREDELVCRPTQLRIVHYAVPVYVIAAIPLPLSIMSGDWVRYVDSASGNPYWYSNDTRETRWDPPPPPPQPTADGSTLVSSDSESGEDEAGKSPVLKGAAKLKALADGSKRKIQDALVRPPSKKRVTHSDGRVVGSETNETAPAPARRTAIEASFDPFDRSLNLNDKHEKDKDGKMVLVKGLKSLMLDVGLKIVRPDQRGTNLRFAQLREYAKDQFDEWHEREGTEWTDSDFIKNVERSELSRDRKDHSAYVKRASEKAAKEAATGDTANEAVANRKKPKIGKSDG